MWTRGDLVNFVNVNDAVLRPLHVAVGEPQEFADQVFDVAADVAGFGEFGGVGLDEGDADQIGGVADEVGFADAGRADENDVLLGVIGRVLAFARQPDMMVMVAQGDAEDFLGLVLFDDEAVQVGLDVARLVIELERFRLRRRLRAFRRAGRFGLGRRPAACAGNAAA